MYNPFESRCSDELNPVEYEAWLDWKDTVDPDFEILKADLPEYYPEDKSPRNACPKCGEMISDFEIVINFGRCPCCDSQLVDNDIPF